MEIITIDSEAYRKLETKINQIANFVYGIKSQGEDRWLNNNEASELLDISIRTLQRLRTDGMINYSIVKGRCRYRLSEIERILSERLISSNPKTLKELQKNHLSKNTNCKG